MRRADTSTTRRFQYIKVRIAYGTEGGSSMGESVDLVLQTSELGPVVGFARRFTRDFKDVFCNDGKLEKGYIAANESLFFSKYSDLIERSSDFDVKRSLFISIFFTWLKIELFINRYEWMCESFLPFYEAKEWDDIFWNSLA